MTADDATDQRDLLGDRVVGASLGVDAPVLRVAADAGKVVIQLQVESTRRILRIVSLVVGERRADERCQSTMTSVQFASAPNAKPAPLAPQACLIAAEALFATLKMSSREIA